jgi:hypothetical protein
MIHLCLFPLDFPVYLQKLEIRRLGYGGEGMGTLEEAEWNALLEKTI